jgi:RimJ/RimL family protein N-acetyltransferase
VDKARSRAEGIVDRAVVSARRGDRATIVRRQQMTPGGQDAVGARAKPPELGGAGDLADRLRVVLAGRVVRLEPLEDRHEQPLWEVAQDPAVWRWMRVRGDESRDVFRGWFDDVRDTAIPFATVLAEKPLGVTSYLNAREHDRVAEIGNTWLARKAWGTGANTEAKLLLLKHAFEQLGLLRVEFKTDARNERARAALAALPAQFEGIFRKHMVVRDGERRDSAWYSITDDEWPEVKATLERRVRLEG